MAGTSEKPAASQPLHQPTLRRELGLRDLVLFSIAGLVGTRWFSTAAHTGPGAFTLWIFAAAFFLVPSAFAIARLSARYPEEGGLYIWTKGTFGEWHGFLCFWIYWIGLAFWLPSSLMAVTSIASYAFGPAAAQYAENRLYVLPASLALLWIALGANLIGLKFGKWIDNIGGLASYFLGALVVVLAAILWFRRGSATPLHLWPQWNWQRLNFWAQICYALTGLELAPVLGGEIKDPERNLPRSSMLAAPLVAACYIAGTLALVVILPPDQISPLNGIAQAVSSGSSSISAQWLTPIAALLIVFGGLGQLSVGGGVAARLPFVVGADAYLPRSLARIHPRWHTPHVAILFFGAVCTAILIFVQLGETARAAYQIVTDLMVIAGFLPYIYIFLSAWKCGGRVSAAMGLTVSGIALACSVIPTAEVTSVWLFEFKLFGVTALLIGSARLLFNHYRRFG